MKRKKIIILSVAAVAVIVIAWAIFGRKSSSNSYYIETATAARGDVSNSVTATGSIEPVTQVEVGTQVSGIIDKLYADYNSVVTKGQLIAEMDKVTLQSELTSQQATYDGAKAEYEYQQKNYLRNQALHEKQLISDTEFEESTYNYAKAKSAYESSEANLAKAKRNLAYATITSPIDGVVISRAVEEGQTVAAGFETPTLFTIAADLTQMQVIADVDEADIGGVKEGQRVEFTVDAYPNDTFEGTVTQVRLEATEESNVITYEVVISAHNPDLKLKPGLTANVTIYIAERRNVVNIPVKALRFVPDPPSSKAPAPEQTPQPQAPDNDSLKTVWVQEGQEWKPRQVKVGMDNGVNVEICSGLNEGEVVAVDRKSNTGMTEAQLSGNQEESPFMPKPPGKKK
ncbi:hemolysin D [Barnesiella viscericola DSM 18177]|uniref:Hemolysin D n=1 Tax=Barnesiella viscericola DSM 18177 TaxID=880074 RepID=W0EVP8_9BACT|nr:efflux RND transporter periplasmic adaptor subunit [Barnesiella viscericola]AHF13264.1 hemolysin D [Barnesiella viscericola DSM 18177]